MICETCGQARHERPPSPLDMIDRLYLAFGKCCAGCDYWEHDPIFTRPRGYCHMQPTGRGMISGAEPEAFTTYQVTDAKHVCPKFQDTFDWTALGVENPAWLQREADQ